MDTIGYRQMLGTAASSPTGSGRSRAVAESAGTTRHPWRSVWSPTVVLVHVGALVSGRVGDDRGATGRAERVTCLRERGDPAELVGLAGDPAARIVRVRQWLLCCRALLLWVE